MYRKLFTYANTVINDEYRAQDIVHETFLTAVRKIDSVRGSTNPEGWLVNTLKNVIKHEFRDRNKIAGVILSLETLEDAAEVSWDYDKLELEDIKASLTAEEWWLLNAVYLEGKKYAEVARELGIEYDACRKRVRKARDKAARLWKDEDL
jgi:RNA polymerase sigma-70 factor (ECF subfamily)